MAKVTKEETNYASQHSLARRNYKAKNTPTKKGQANYAGSDLGRTGMTFKEAFDLARSKGMGGFVFKGNSYNTRNSGESVDAWKKKMDAARSKLSKNDEYRESGGVYINGKYLQDKDYNNKDAQRAYSKTPDKRKVNDYARVQNREKKNYTSEPTYASSYDPNLFARVVGTISPSQQVGAISRGLRDASGQGFFNSYFDAMYGLKDTKDAYQNQGVFSVSQGGENFAKNHQNVAAGTNFLFDAAVGGLASEGKLGQYYKPGQVKLASAYDAKVAGTNWLGRPRVVEGETIVPRYVQKVGQNGQFVKGFQHGQFGHRAYQTPSGDYYMDNNLTYSPAQAVVPTAAGTVGRNQQGTSGYFDDPGYSTGEIVITAKRK